MKDPVEQIEEMIKAHRMSTDVRGDEYFRGMLNGMICVHSVLTGREPAYECIPVSEAPNPCALHSPRSQDCLYCVKYAFYDAKERIIELERQLEERTPHVDATRTEDEALPNREGQELPEVR